MPLFTEYLSSFTRHHCCLMSSILRIVLSAIRSPCALMAHRYFPHYHESDLRWWISDPSRIPRRWVHMGSAGSIWVSEKLTLYRPTLTSVFHCNRCLIMYMGMLSYICVVQGISSPFKAFHGLWYYMSAWAVSVFLLASAKSRVSLLSERLPGWWRWASNVGGPSVAPHSDTD